MANEVNIKDSDRLYVRKVVGLFINDAAAARVNPINEDVVRVVGEMVAESLKCSQWLDLVPKPVAPVGPRPGIKWSIKQIRKLGIALVQSEKEHALPCSKVSALKFRTRLEQAQAGVLFQ